LLAQAPRLDRALTYRRPLKLDFIGGPTFDLADDLRKFAIDETETLNESVTAASNQQMAPALIPASTTPASHASRRILSTP
jgi:hypothetical protein